MLFCRRFIGLISSSSGVMSTGQLTHFRSPVNTRCFRKRSLHFSVGRSSSPSVKGTNHTTGGETPKGGVRDAVRVNICSSEQRGSCCLCSMSGEVTTNVCIDYYNAALKANGASQYDMLASHHWPHFLNLWSECGQKCGHTKNRKLRSKLKRMIIVVVMIVVIVCDHILWRIYRSGVSKCDRVHVPAPAHTFPIALQSIQWMSVRRRRLLHRASSDLLFDWWS